MRPSYELVGPGIEGRVKFGFRKEKTGATPSLVKQVHGKIVLNQETILNKTELPEADAIYTRSTGAGIWVFTADCLPVILAGGATIAAIHAGWRGSKLGIVREAISVSGLAGKKFHAVFGPALLACCFEVKEDFVTEFSAARGDLSAYLERREEKWFFDLVRFVMIEEFKGESQVTFHAQHIRCTRCSVPELPSFRRNKVAEPRIRTWVERN